ncbi:MAG TPA: branched-chain amino acid ABC transporter permease [Acidimicrobiia bacterium]|nr:branched-chain amino acid ABC transporter permease [Acidimicrobiia bacterium]
MSLPRNRLGPLAGGVAIAAALAGPAVADDAMLRTLAGVFMFGGLASAWNIIGGFTGYASFGNVVFFGLGGYTIAVLMVHARLSFWAALPVAVAVGAVYATLVGLPVLRLRGHYFAIATLGVAEGTREVVLNLPDLTGGGAGISLPVLGAQAVTSSPGNTGFYYLFLAAMGVAVAVAFAVSRSRFGYALAAIRDDEQGAAATGINTTRAKLAAFALSGALTSLVGALFAFQQVAIYPERLFSVEITVLMVAMAVIGGLGTVVGPVIGAVGLQLLAEYLRQRYLGLHLIVFGSLLVAVVVLMPEGLVSKLSQAWRERRLGLLDTVRRYRV